jgi:uncharacterized protein (DUF1778 family)
MEAIGRRKRQMKFRQVKDAGRLHARYVHGDVLPGHYETEPLHSQGAKEQRIALRLSQRNKGIIQKAAALSSKDVTEYILSIVYPDAERVLRDAAVTTLSIDAFEAFSQKLSESPTPTEALTGAGKRYRELFGT